MKTIQLILSTLIAGLLLSLTAQAQSEFITAKEFMKLYKSNDDLVIIDANKASNYANAHIKGAIHINHNDLYKEGDVSGLIMEPEDLATFFGEKGVSNTATIVLTDDGSQKYSGRLYWILEYLGAENLLLLHRDMDEWRSVRIPLESTPTVLDPVTFTANVNPDLYASTAYVKEKKDMDNVVLIDARSPEEYNGTSKSDGHIPGAININYADLEMENGFFKSAEDLTALLAEKGVTPDMEVIAYCKTSVRAGVVYIALKNLLGYENVKVYDGAYSEWVVENPVEQ
jgi:thiosulfate/3-mercaptopyruvate sulfurtransferase